MRMRSGRKIAPLTSGDVKTLRGSPQLDQVQRSTRREKELPIETLYQQKYTATKVQEKKVR